ncbi:MAG: hypothetical protein ACXWHF_00810 [Chthoniobacterales bacterium]
MTTQQKTAAIQQILANYQDNVNASNAAQVPAGLNALVIQARNNALVDDLQKLFATPPQAATGTRARRSRG